MPSSLTRFAREIAAVHRIGGWACCGTFVIRTIANLRGVLARRSLAPVDESMRGRSYSFRVCGRVVCLDGDSFAGAREIYGRQVYFALPGFLLESSDIVVDLGANAGVFTTLAALTAGKVVAVEAQYGFLGQLRAHLAMNGSTSKADVVFGVVGASSGVISTPGFVSPEFTREPPTLSMSDLFTRYALSHVDFMKVDIEGSEFDLFANTNGWLSRVRRIAMEVHRHFGDPSELAELLRRNGFEVWLVDNGQRIVDSIEEESGYLFAMRRTTGTEQVECSRELVA